MNQMPQLRLSTPTTTRGGESYMSSVGPYWSRSNADFEATKPNMLQRAARQINPATGFGSALGEVHDAASSGDLPKAAMSAAGAIPVFASMRAAVPSITRTLRGVTSNATTAASTGQLQSGAAAPIRDRLRSAFSTNITPNYSTAAVVR